MVGSLAGAGADVVMLELMDIVASGLVPPEHAGPLDERMRELAALTRRVARRQGAVLVEMRRHPASADPGVYAERPAPPQRPWARDRRGRGGARAARGAPRSAPAQVAITEEELLADLSWPGPPPGEWRVPQRSARRAGARGALVNMR